jgi:hypothetical protein
MTLGQLDLARPALLSLPDEGYPQMVIIQSVGMEHADGSIGLTLCAHGYKGKTIGLTAFAVLDDIDGCNISGLREQAIQVFLRRRFGQIPYIDLDFHQGTAFSGCTGKERAASP